VRGIQLLHSEATSELPGTIRLLDIDYSVVYNFCMATLYDVAKAAGVSTASVSRFINDPSSVSNKIASKIKDAIEKLDYCIDSSARSLKTGKFGRVRIISPATGPFYWEIISAIAYSLSPSGYAIDITFTREPKYRRNDRNGLLTKRNVDGTIFFPLRTNEDDEFIRHLVEAGECFVAIDRDIDRGDVHQIVIDDYDIGKTAACVFLEHGHTQFIFIKGNDDLDSTHERLRGFKDALYESNIVLDSDRIIDGKYNPEITYNLAKAGIGHFPPFTAVFASNDLSAIAFSKAVFEQKGLHIPRDYSIISVDDSDYIPYFLPQISSFRLPLQTIGSIAAGMLLAQIEGSKIKEKKVVLKADLVKRDSVSTKII
jgi:DNA-binding LacI/PurR family transcriptional regulator